MTAGTQTGPRERRSYQSHKRTGANSPRVTVVLPAADAAEIKRRAKAEGLSESAVVALMVANSLRPPSSAPAAEEGEDENREAA